MQPQSYVSYGTYGSYGSALFPTSLFPSLSSYVSPPPKPTEAAANKPAERDELIELGAILFLLKLALG
jgi:hypothetical protein